MIWMKAVGLTHVAGESVDVVAVVAVPAQPRHAERAQLGLGVRHGQAVVASCRLAAAAAAGGSMDDLGPRLGSGGSLHVVSASNSNGGGGTVTSRCGPRSRRHEAGCIRIDLETALLCQCNHLINIILKR